MKNYKNKGTSTNRGLIPLSDMAVITVEKMLECLKEAGLTNCAELLKSECKSKKVNYRVFKIFLIFIWVYLQF